MALNIVELPYSYFPDFNRGRPLFNADIYVGNVDTDPEIPANQKQVTVRQEDGTEVQIAQPVKTSAGGVPTYNGSPVTVLVDGSYSIKVIDRFGAEEYYSPDVTKGIPITPESLPTYTDLVYKSSSGKSAVDNMIEGNPIAASVGDVCSTGGMAWIRTAVSAPSVASDFNALSTINVKDFGAIGDGVADDTEAIQSAINFASNNGAYTVFVPFGVYQVERLLFHYDSVNNPGFNPSDDRQGAICLLGDGRMSQGNILNNERIGTHIICSTLSEPALYCDGRTSTGTSFRGDGFRVERMSITANTSEPVVFGDRTPQNSGMDSVLVQQNGTGSGVEFKDTWYLDVEKVFIIGAGASNSRYGLWVHNQNLAAGFVECRNIGTNGFDVGVYIGHNDRVNAARLHNVHMSSIQGGESNIGVVIGGGIDESSVNLHAEQCTTGVKVKDNPKRTTIQMTTSGNAKDLEIGSSISAENYATQITVNNSNFLSDSLGVEIFAGSNINGVTLQNCAFTSTSGTIGIKLQDNNYNSLRLKNIMFSGSYSTQVENPNRVKEIPWITSTSGVLTLAPGHPEVITVTPTGANRSVTLPIEGLSGELLLTFKITNPSSSSFSAIVRDSSNTNEVKTLPPGTGGVFWCDGVNWHSV